MVKSGLDVIRESNYAALRGKRVGLVCHQASIAADLTHAVDLFKAAHDAGIFQWQSAFGPQHGLWGHTQDNMIEWEGGAADSRLGVPVYSLYGKHRKPTEKMLAGLDTLVIDLQDVGAKYYTFIWTMALCMEACVERGLEVVVLDRPNPIGGVQTEGPAINEDFRSFVGLYPLTIRHGLTIGEVAAHLHQHYFPSLSLNIVRMQGWRRTMYFEDTGLPWALPSPNIPVPESTVVYPGMCLLEATNLSEGRGTTRPFDIFGAAWMDGWAMARHLAAHRLPGVAFRPFEFQPTFHKFAGEVCGGCFIHVTDRRQYKPFLTAIALLLETRRHYGRHFRWNDPPYEYEYEKLPIDILVGNDWLREGIDGGLPLAELEVRWQAESEGFRPQLLAAHLYDPPLSPLVKGG